MTLVFIFVMVSFFIIGCTIFRKRPPAKEAPLAEFIHNPYVPSSEEPVVVKKHDPNEDVRPIRTHTPPPILPKQKRRSEII